MWKLTKRSFLRLAGLAIADRIVPKRLFGRDHDPTDHKVIIVTFGGGVRYSETFTPEGIQNIPRLAELRPYGFFYANCYNNGVLSHYNSTASILTGNWQRVDDFGFEPPASPTIFEYYRRATGTSPLDTWAICTNKSFSTIGSSSNGLFGPDYGANVVLPKQLLLEAVQDVVKKGDQYGVAKRENVLQQLESILNAGYEGVGWTIFKANNALDRRIKETLTKSLVEYIYGPEAPSSGDELTFFIAREIMREFAPRLMLVNFWDMDIAHWGAYSLYLQAVTRTDRLCGMLWDEIQQNPHYKDKTTLIILPELGRDGDMNTDNGFLNHRSGDPSCRHVWLLAFGPHIKPGETDRPIYHVDLMKTVGEILGFKVEETIGEPLKEIL